MFGVLETEWKKHRSNFGLNASYLSADTTSALPPKNFYTLLEFYDARKLTPLVRYITVKSGLIDVR